MEVHGHIRLHMNGTHLHMQALESAGVCVFVCVVVWWGVQPGVLMLMGAPAANDEAFKAHIHACLRIDSIPARRAGGTVFDELWLTQPQKKHKHRGGAEGLQAAEQAARTSGRADARVAAA